MDKQSKEELKMAIQSIVIADDDYDDQLLFKDALAEVDRSIQLETTSDGMELLALLRNYKPDILFLDLDMPAKNGLECLKAIRTNPIYTDLPVVVFSSTSRASNIEVAYEMGAHLFFIKPSFYKDLVVLIKHILQLDWSAPEGIKSNLFNEGKYLPVNYLITGKEVGL
jgi:CheY-like chemotaxis protein